MRLFAICPRIRQESGRVVATTAWRVRVFSLGTLFRQVTIDPNTKTVSVDSRYLWLIRRQRQLPFRDIRAVTYGYQDLSSDSLFSFAHDSFDWFTVGLRIKSDKEIHLFNFIGEGTFSNNGPLPDWVYWGDFANDVSGSQEKESRVFVDVLSKMTGSRVSPPRR